MAKSRTSFRCTQCTHLVAKWVGRCPECGEWGSIAEAPVLTAATPGLNGAARATQTPLAPALPMTQVDVHTARVRPTGVAELDRVLGGGMVPGAVVLLAGEPGVGKSTLLLEVVRQWAQQDRTQQDRTQSGKALYVTGEESAGQVRLRAGRTSAVHERVSLAAETDLA
ncbi:MAG: AAA family ATPase, partial [Mycobacteriaceae bacterium]